MLITILGAGAGGAAAVAELTRAGHDVTLWARSPDTLAPFAQAGGVAYDGVLGEGLAVPRHMTADLREAIADAEACLVVLPTTSHAPMARALAAAGWGDERPVVLNPGHTGGALEFATAARAAGSAPPIAEFSTLTYVARKLTPEKVTITGRARSVRTAPLPGGEAALEVARALYDCATPAADVLATGLSNVNMVLHTPGGVLAAAWVEAREGDFTFYVDGMTPGVTRVLARLDGERRRVAAAFGHDLPGVIEEMQAIGTVEADVADPADLAAAISGGQANRRIKAPSSLEHRYYREDFGHGLLPFMELAAIAGVDVPVASALFALGEAAVGTDYRAGGRTAAAMGIAGLEKEALMERVRWR